MVATFWELRAEAYKKNNDNRKGAITESCTECLEVKSLERR